MANAAKQRLNVKLLKKSFDLGALVLFLVLELVEVEPLFLVLEVFDF